jgi:hypothetical protein
MVVVVMVVVVVVVGGVTLQLSHRCPHTPAHPARRFRCNQYRLAREEVSQDDTLRFDTAPQSLVTTADPFQRKAAQFCERESSAAPASALNSPRRTCGFERIKSQMQF